MLFLNYSTNLFGLNLWVLMLDQSRKCLLFDALISPSTVPKLSVQICIWKFNGAIGFFFILFYFKVFVVA